MQREQANKEREMQSLANALKGVARASKKAPVVGRIFDTVHFAIWRGRMERDWARRYEESPLVASAAGDPPSLSRITSQLCTATQFREGAYGRWCREMRTPARFARKQWEFVYILEALSQHGMLQPEKTGLGFGCGNEPLAAVMAKHGAKVLATDLATAEATDKGWVESNEHAATLDGLNDFGICDWPTFRRNVGFEFADMNAVPEKFDGQFDFVWSACAFEHLGSIRHGLDFVKNSVRCLKPGGVAVHTTEFNLSSNDQTLEDPGCVIFRRRDMELLATELESLGYEVASFNFNPGSAPIDHHIDAPPYGIPHLKLALEGYVATSIGLIVKRPFGS
ncbi:SAM-dependent methyltransferase [Paraburkholderia sp. J12]|uniref:SAM-dependent methyltransferase n=1 Tax=Paraburkholderia sp. J12 TaxID=2805432 RepID=UPI002ABD98C0|nr:methyltransferase domain-containing protein [Paraburkholderia sp. J12]